MEKICGIYKITNPKGKIYIGQSINIFWRWYNYKKLYCKNQRILYNSFKKYGWEKHKFEIICQCDKSELNKLEKYYINLFDTFNSKYGMNIRSGGDFNNLFSDEARKNMSLAQIGRKDTPEQIKKKSERMKGVAFFKGHKHRSESIQKGIETKRRKGTLKHSQETTDKITSKTRGMKRTPEQCANIGRSRKGKPTWNKGLKGSQLAWNKGLKVPPEIVKCPHCNKTGAKNMMHRWHFENCKSKYLTVQKKELN